MEIVDPRAAERYLEGFINLERAHQFDYERLGLRRVQTLLERLGNPQAGLPSVHITGSKGKGTVAFAAEALLGAAGVRVGTYTSPHLVRWSERFRVAGRAIGSGELVEGVRKLQPVLEELRSDAELRPSFFDVSTALAFWLFRELGVQAGVIEVGLGGRIDSTNVTHSRVSVLSTVQLEHTDKLGGTLAQIAREKVGIGRAGVPFLHGPLDPKAHAVLLARSSALDFDVEEVRAQTLELRPSGQRLRLCDGRELWAGVTGRHQAVNLALAVRAAEVFLGRPARLQELDALAQLRVPARFELVRPDLLVDTAHTPDSACALASALEELWPGRRIALLLSVSRDKDASGIAAALAPLARSAVATRAQAQRSAPAEQLAPLLAAGGVERVECQPDLGRALARARELRAPGELLVATGSVYLAGGVLELLEAEDGSGPR